MNFGDAAVQRFLDGRRVMSLATLNPDGAPLVTPVWFVHTRDALYLYSMTVSRKVRNIVRDPRVSVAVEHGERADDIRFVIIRGTAAVVNDGREIEMAARALLDRYGTDLRDRWGMQQLPPDRSAVRITPEAVLARGVV